jgi:hypothetical protein
LTSNPQVDIYFLSAFSLSTTSLPKGDRYLKRAIDPENPLEAERNTLS